LKRGILARNPQPGLVFHSDREIEYSAYDFQDYLRERGFIPSMNRPRTCQDNAHMESFFRSLKTEFVQRRIFATDAQLTSQLGLKLSMRPTASWQAFVFRTRGRKNVPVSARRLSRTNRELMRMRDRYPQTNLSASFSLSDAFLVDKVITGLRLS
jgi:transposase InsO family protein